MNFEFVKDKFSRAELTEISSELARPPRVAECPVQLEAKVEKIHDVDSPESSLAAIEVRIIRAYFDENILNSEKSHYVDTDKWKPLDYEFLRVLRTWRKSASFKTRQSILKIFENNKTIGRRTIKNARKTNQRFAND